MKNLKLLECQIDVIDVAMVRLNCLGLAFLTTSNDKITTAEIYTQFVMTGHTGRIDENMPRGLPPELFKEP